MLTFTVKFRFFPRAVSWQRIGIRSRRMKAVVERIYLTIYSNPRSARISPRRRPARNHYTPLRRQHSVFRRVTGQRDEFQTYLNSLPRPSSFAVDRVLPNVFDFFHSKLDNPESLSRACASSRALVELETLYLSHSRRKISNPIGT